MADEETLFQRRAREKQEFQEKTVGRIEDMTPGDWALNLGIIGAGFAAAPFLGSLVGTGAVGAEGVAVTGISASKDAELAEEGVKIALAAAGLFTFTAFIWEEAMQTAMFPIGLLIRANMKQEARRQIDVAEGLLAGSKVFADTLLRLNIISQPAFAANNEAVRASLDMYKLILARPEPGKRTRSGLKAV